MTKNQQHIPHGAWPHGLSREQAAAFVGVSASFFDTLVAQGVYPKPVVFGTRRVWHRPSLEAAFDKARGASQSDPFLDRLNEMVHCEN